MKRGLKILLSVVLVLGLAAAAGYWFLSRPIEVEPLPEGPAPQATLERNSLIETMLAGVGIEDPLVDVRDTQAYVAYHAPAGTDAAGLSTFQLRALMALAEGAPDAKLGAATAFVDGEAALFWSGDLDALRAAGTDGERLAAFVESVEKRPL